MGCATCSDTFPISRRVVVLCIGRGVFHMWWHFVHRGGPAVRRTSTGEEVSAQARVWWARLASDPTGLAEGPGKGGADAPLGDGTLSEAPWQRFLRDGRLVGVNMSEPSFPLARS